MKKQYEQVLQYHKKHNLKIGVMMPLEGMEKHVVVARLLTVIQDFLIAEKVNTQAEALARILYETLSVCARVGFDPEEMVNLIHMFRVKDDHDPENLYEDRAKEKDLIAVEIERLKDIVAERSAAIEAESNKEPEPEVKSETKSGCKTCEAKNEKG